MSDIKPMSSEEMRGKMAFMRAAADPIISLLGVDLWLAAASLRAGQEAIDARLGAIERKLDALIGKTIPIIAPDFEAEAKLARLRVVFDENDDDTYEGDARIVAALRRELGDE